MAITSIEQISALDVGQQIIVTPGRRGQPINWSKVEEDVWLNNETRVPSRFFTSSVAAGLVTLISEAAIEPGSFFFDRSSGYYLLVVEVDEAGERALCRRYNSDDEGGRDCGAVFVAFERLRTPRYFERKDAPLWIQGLYPFIRDQYQPMESQVNALRAEVERLNIQLREAAVPEQQHAFGMSIEELRENLHRFAGTFPSSYEDDAYDEFLNSINMGRQREFEVDVRVTGTTTLPISHDMALVAAGWNGSDITVEDIDATMTWSDAVTLIMNGTSCRCGEVDREMLAPHLPAGAVIGDFAIESCGC